MNSASYHVRPLYLSIGIWVGNRDYSLSITPINIRIAVCDSMQDKEILNRGKSVVDSYNVVYK